MPDRPATTHDLIRLRKPIALTMDASVPPWVEPALRRTPWVVVRRGHVRDGMIPVGVRGLVSTHLVAELPGVRAVSITDQGLRYATVLAARWTTTLDFCVAFNWTAIHITSILARTFQELPGTEYSTHLFLSPKGLGRSPDLLPCRLEHEARSIFWLSSVLVPSSWLLFRVFKSQPL
jgi:hypothetical protein